MSVQSCKYRGIIALSAQIPELFEQKSSSFAMKRLFVRTNKLLVSEMNFLLQLVPRRT